MNRQRSMSEKFTESAKLQGKGCQNGLHMEDSSRASALHSVEVKERGGVVQEEYDRLLGKICEEISYGDIWLTFPEGGRDAVEITSNDMESVQPGGFLSDNVVDFYIKYLWEGLSCHMPKDHLHFFNSFFFTQLADNCGASTESEQRKTAFEKVRSWTRGVNIFEKAYVFIPVNQSYHWSLIIICHLSSLTSLPGKQGCPPCILHLDSVEGKHGNLESHIRSYIIHAWKERYHDPSVNQLLALSQMKYAEVEVPQQNNHYDCGIYLLHFVELFLVESLGGFGSVPNQGSLFSALWDASEVSAKRRGVRNLILELSLASRRKSQRHQKLISRLLRLMPVSQISEVLETRLDGGRREAPQNNDLKQSNARVDESEHANHQTAGGVSLDNQQHTETEHVCHQSTGGIVLDDQQHACAKSNPIKERNKRYRSWSEDETSLLLDCMKGGRFWKKRKQGSTDWIAISQEIENKLGTTPSGDQCRLRYETLSKAYNSYKDYCMRVGKQFPEVSWVD